jgi:hypothetical protein
MLETSLYLAVNRFFETAGFRVNGEVNGCNVVAVHDEDPQRLVIVEMKLGFSFDLLLRAVERMRGADRCGWPCRRPGADVTGIAACAISADWAHGRRRGTQSNRGVDRARSISATAGSNVAVPDAQRACKAAGDPSPGGSARQPIMTAYRQQAIACSSAERRLSALGE